MIPVVNRIAGREFCSRGRMGIGIIIIIPTVIINISSIIIFFRSNSWPVVDRCLSCGYVVASGGGFIWRRNLDVLGNTANSQLCLAVGVDADGKTKATWILDSNVSQKIPFRGRVCTIPQFKIGAKVVLPGNIEHGMGLRLRRETPTVI